MARSKAVLALLSALPFALLATYVATRAIEAALQRWFAPATVQVDQPGQHRLLYPVARLFQERP